MIDSRSWAGTCDQWRLAPFDVNRPWHKGRALFFQCSRKVFKNYGVHKIVEFQRDDI